MTAGDRVGGSIVRYLWVWVREGEEVNAVSYMRLDRIWGRRAGSQLATAAFG